MEVKIVIPTAWREKTIISHLYVNNTIVCCPESQAAAYKETIGDKAEILPHPDSVVGLARKRQWIYDKFRNVFMMDDDMEGLMDLTAKRHEGYRLNPERGYDVIQNAANIARLMGCKMFGFNQYKDPLHYSGHDPFRLTGFINACGMGLLEDGWEKLKFCTEIQTNGDFYLSALNAYYFRKCFVDNRFTFKFFGFANSPGGSTNIRSRETEANDLKILQRDFGEAIQIKPMVTGVSRAKHETAKRLVIPY